MEEDIMQLQTCGSDNGNDRDAACNLSHVHELELDEVEVAGHVPNGENLEQSTNGAELEGDRLLIHERESTGDVIGDSSTLQERVDCIEKSETEILDYVAQQSEAGCFNDTEVEEGQLILEMNIGEDAVIENADFTGAVTEIKGEYVAMPFENGCMTETETSNSYPETDGGSISGVKRMQSAFDEQRQSVHVKYYGLSRQSKRKLEELLQEWSEWTAQNCSMSQDKNEESESGEEIYYPALDIGMGKTSAVSFWVENEIRKPQNKDFAPVEDDSVPLYDRGFALGLISADGSSNLEGGMDLLEAPRCFNCRSYSHSLKECPKPRDNVAVNSSRKQLKSRRNKTAGMRNVARYYQDSPGGKYEGLKPGVLDAETRRLLDLVEFDPPPWLNRMREIGYPPGYLEPEDERLPSGITIYAEEIDEDKVEGEEGEILEAEVVEPQRKLSVDFPGINAPIPPNADERLWAPRPLSSSDRHRNGHSSESNNRGRYREHNTRNFKDDDSLGFERAPRHPPKYGDYDSGYTSRSSRENAQRPRSPPSSSGRYVGDRARNDPSDSEDYLAYSLYSSYSYSSTRRSSQHGNGLDDRSTDRDDRYRYRSGR